MVSIHMLYSPACVYGISTHVIPLSITSFLHGAWYNYLISMALPADTEKLQLQGVQYCYSSTEAGVTLHFLLGGVIGCLLFQWWSCSNHSCPRVQTDLVMQNYSRFSVSLLHAQYISELQLLAVFSYGCFESL